MIHKFFLFFLLVNFSLFSKSDTTLIKRHFNKIIDTQHPRNYLHPNTLDTVATYLETEFNKYADTVYFQPYMVNGKKYKNVIAVFQQEFEETIIIGAHYDVCENQTGADDNASGTVGLLEIARQLKDQKLKKRVELVAFTLEEPPFFRSEYMGSFIHAKSMKENNRNVIGMICLEMIGYFDDSKNSQEYPIEALKLKFGNRGDFITLVNRINQGEFSSEFTKNYVELSKIKTKKFSGPKSLQGIDFSDHLNYWKFGYSALMITDTAFFRNKNYHQKTDTLDTLDLPRMALVIDGVIETLLHLYR